MSTEAILFGIIVATLIVVIIKPYFKTLELIRIHYDNYFNALYHSNINNLLTDFECDCYLKNLRSPYYLSIIHLYGTFTFEDCVINEPMYDISIERLKECAKILKSEEYQIEESTTESNLN